MHRSVADLASLIDTFSRRGVVALISAVAQWEREAPAERTSAALQVLKQQGRATGGVAPYGYHSSSTGAGHGTRASRKPL